MSNTDQALLDQMKAYIEAALGFNPDPAATQQILESGEIALQDADAGDYRNALEQVMVEHDVPQEQQEMVYDQVEAGDTYTPEAIKELLISVSEQGVVNTVDQSLDSHGTVHGSIDQNNYSNVANATGEGSLAGQYVEGNQTQTGDGQQVGGNSGVQNDGDNSGQIAGGNATADNVTSGDNNTVGSGHASQVGAGQVSQDGAYIDDSAQAFGEGDATNTSTDTYDSHNTHSVSASATDSFNEYDDDVNTQTQTIETGYGHDEYQPLVPHDDYKIDDHHDDDYKVDDHHHGDDYDQDAEILDAN